MEENNVKITCGRAGLELHTETSESFFNKIWRSENF